MVAINTGPANTPWRSWRLKMSSCALSYRERDAHHRPAAHAPAEPGSAPTFSVIIAAYRAAALGDAVRSAPDQISPPLEVIVCYDGIRRASVDGRPAVATHPL
jgi:hypothetical protein